MPNYNIRMARTLSASLSVGSVEAGATARRCYIFETTLGVSAAPASFANEWEFQRFTVAGTGTGVTPQSLLDGDPAALANAKENYTIEPTLTAGAILDAIPLNQQATYIWQSSPGSELVVPATTGNGIALRTPIVGNLVATVVKMKYRE